MKNTRIEFHLLQSFPVTCLNRDDNNAPKTAMIGGVQRARVSSQCWKRQVRIAMQQLGIKTGIRTKKVGELLRKACLELGAEGVQAEKCAEKIAALISADTLVFVSESEVKAFAQYAQEHEFNLDDISDKVLVKEVAKVSKKALNPAIDALDIALFGRMVAKAPTMDIEAASSFSHAISTHKVTNEIDFFTAVDDIKDIEANGSSHMGTLEFNSATYYRYISLDLGQLAETFGIDMEADQDQIRLAIEAFTKALFMAVPEARQTTQSGACPWEYAKVMVRNGQRLQVPFESPVLPQKGSYLAPSIEAMTDYLDAKESMFGSMFGKLGSYEWGIDKAYSIDNLIEDLKGHVA